MTDDLAEGWRVWSDADDRLVLAYRPDVFDGGDFPPPCLPTIYVTRGSRTRRPGVRPNPRPDDPWHVTLFLEPEVKHGPHLHDDREEAFETARDLAERFARGEIDYRGLYQVPREEYFERLDELTGRDSGREA
ncbi:DUF5820 family protein [Halomarina halobia]|uniref:DUF5820 family protein n=1 Tax=Halomarina halobia TaxID=3033386 RepID=A0ABD6A4S1_9EURY|nr:DUF5820 family protein [Halomarina sp. PSR21]